MCTHLWLRNNNHFTNQHWIVQFLICLIKPRRWVTFGWRQNFFSLDKFFIETCHVPLERYFHAESEKGFTQSVKFWKKIWFKIAMFWFCLFFRKKKKVYQNNTHHLVVLNERPQVQSLTRKMMTILIWMLFSKKLKNKNKGIKKKKKTFQFLRKKIWYYIFTL